MRGRPAQLGDDVTSIKARLIPDGELCAVISRLDGRTGLQGALEQFLDFLELPVQRLECQVLLNHFFALGAK